MMPKSPYALAALLLTALALPAHAEKADREKPMNIEADRMSMDDINKVQVFEGNVVLNQGTLQMRTNRLVVTQDADGFQKGVSTGGAGGLARFKQKRDGVDEYMEGEAERIDHDTREEKTEFFIRGWVKNGQDEVKGHYIQYDSLTEQYLVTASKMPGEASPGVPPGRVRAIIQPKNKDTESQQGATGSRESLTLKPAISLPSRKE